MAAGSGLPSPSQVTTGLCGQLHRDDPTRPHRAQGIKRSQGQVRGHNEALWRYGCGSRQCRHRYERRSRHDRHRRRFGAGSGHGPSRRSPSRLRTACDVEALEGYVGWHDHSDEESLSVRLKTRT
jgi:hypothetical protein